MTKVDRPGMTWGQMERARRARARQEYLETTPGQRVEEQLALSYELTRLAAKAPRRK